MPNAVQRLFTEQGQSPWLDFIRRNMLEDGGLRRYAEQDGIRGVTANPTIFEKAIAAGTDYDAQITRLVREGVPAAEMFEHIAVQDISQACDILRPVYDASEGGDGFVSIEVSPELAFKTRESIEEAQRWHHLIERPNLFVKIPGTDAGLPAIEECLYAGVNINITLLFAVEMYEQVMEAYLRALERRAADGAGLDSVRSVASFFVSRVDTSVDKRLDQRIESARTDAERKTLASLKGKAAIANAKVAYQRFLAVFGSERFKRLAARGARVQRPLWASTGTKNPDYSDILYVQELIGPDTVNTMPPQTIDAFRDHGQVRRTVDEDLDGAHGALRQLHEIGVSLREVTDELQVEGVQLFAESFRKIGESTMRKAAEIARSVDAA